MIKVAVIFGGPSREREIAFAGGRTVYDNLDKSLFEVVPVFIDSLRQYIVLDWNYIYKGTIRDFYPPVSFLPDGQHQFQVYIESLQNSEVDLKEVASSVGRLTTLNELSKEVDFAFLSLHGEYGEDGQIQQELEGIGLPYSGSGVKGCQLGMDKALQKKLMSEANWPTPPFSVIKRSSWLNSDKQDLVSNAIDLVGNPAVIRPANQGSSIGVSIVDSNDTNAVTEAIDHSFFVKKLQQDQWNQLSEQQQVAWVRDCCDIRSGLGMPLHLNGELITHPNGLLPAINNAFTSHTSLELTSVLKEEEVVVEGFIKGREFSCIVIIDDNGKAIGLPPTEIIKGGEVYDYRSKYLAGLSRKVTPIDLPSADIKRIRKACEDLYLFFGFNVYARIDGFFTESGEIFLNDPNTTSGMLPSSFFFHQAAEIGLNPSEFITYIIRTSLAERKRHSNMAAAGVLLTTLDSALEAKNLSESRLKNVAVFLGGYSSERHISVESGRNIFEKLSSSATYHPIPIFVSGSNENHELYQIPINYLLKDNADDIRDKIADNDKHEIIEEIRESCAAITSKYASISTFSAKPVEYADLPHLVDMVFIALHGRPGEDGQVQQHLEQIGLPFNGSTTESSIITIDKFMTKAYLAEAGFTVAKGQVIQKQEYFKNAESVLEEIESEFYFPLIAKPVDDGCSSAVKLIRSKEQLDQFIRAIFRDDIDFGGSWRAELELKPKEEFPMKDRLLIEQLIKAEDESMFMEVTVGLLTHYKDGELVYEVFEPSETLSSGAILSLEEKFLAGEGQNITPARLSKNPDQQQRLSNKIKIDIERVAKILKIQGYARIDAFVRIDDNENVETIVIEANSLPGMTPATCIFHQAALNNYNPFEFIHQILEFGSKRMQTTSITS